MALTRKQRLVKNLLLSDPDMGWVEAARKAGYSNPKTEAVRLQKNAQMVTALAISKHLAMEPDKITREMITGALWGLYEYAVEEGPLTMWNEAKGAYENVGYREPDIKAAKDVLKLIGEDKGMFKKDVNVNLNPGGQPIMFKKVPASIRELLDEEYGQGNNKS